MKVSAGTCDDLAESLRRRHERNGTRWRLLSPLAQAVLVIAFLRTNLTYAELAAGFGVPAATCWRDVAEGISVLADRGRRISLKDVARQAGIAGDILAFPGLFADLGYLGLDREVVTGRRRPRGGQLTPAQKAANRLQAQLRCIGERGNAQLKHWKALVTELRCRPERCTAVIKAVLALHYLENDPFAKLRAA